MGKIDELIDKVANNPPSQKEGVVKQQRQELAQIISSYPIAAEKIDFTVYQTLLAGIEAALAESSLDQLSGEVVKHELTDEMKQEARTNALKLTLVFGTLEQAIQYLKRFEENQLTTHEYEKPPASALIHDACIFQLPLDKTWNIDLWRALFKYHTVSNPENVLMRLLPFAPAIEEYVYQHQTELKEAFRDSLIATHRARLAQEFDASFSPLTEEQLEEKLNTSARIKAIERQVENELDSRIRKDFGLSGKGSVPQELLEKYKARKKAISAEERAATYAQIKEQNREQLLAEYARKKPDSQDKEAFIEAKLKKLTSGNNEIAQRLKNKEWLTPTTSLDDLIMYGKDHVYQRSKERADVAELFFKYGIPESGFNSYLDLTPVNDDKKIPPITIEGRELQAAYPNFVLTKMDAHNPLVAIIGRVTSCCQAMGHQGESCAIHSITKGGLFIIQEGAGNPKEENIRAQSWVWRNGNILVADSIESHLNFYAKEKQAIIDFYINLAIRMCLETEISEFYVGRGGRTPEKLGFFKLLVPANPADYKGYRDSHNQKILMDQELIAPFIDLYRDQGVTLSNYDVSNSLPLSEQAIKKWVDLCLTNNQESALRYLNPYVNPDQEHFFTSYLTLAKKWQNYLQNLDIKKPPSLQELKPFIEQGANLNYPQGKGDGLLWLAVRQSDLELTRYLLNHGIDVNAEGSFGSWRKSVLELAFIKANRPMIELLIEKGAYLEQELILNISSGLYEEFITLNKEVLSDADKIAVIKLLINTDKTGDLLKAKDYLGQNVLFAGVQLNSLELIQLMLEKDPSLDVNAKNYRNVTPLLLAAQADLAIFSFLMEKGANPAAQDSEGQTVLSYAIKNKKWDIVQSALNSPLLKDVTVRYEDLEKMGQAKQWDLVSQLLGRVDKLLEPQNNRAKSTRQSPPPLVIQAAEDQQWDIVRALILKGADPDAKGKDNNSLLDKAFFKRLPPHKLPSDWSLYMSLYEEEVWKEVQWLVEHGADITKNDSSALHRLIEDQNYEWQRIQWLLVNTVKIDFTDNNSKNNQDNALLLLERVARKGKPQQMAWIVENHNQILEKHGTLLLNTAVQSHNREMIDWLISKHYFEDLFQVALKCNYFDTVKVLIEFEFKKNPLTAHYLTQLVENIAEFNSKSKSANNQDGLIGYQMTALKRLCLDIAQNKDDSTLKDCIEQWKKRNDVEKSGAKNNEHLMNQKERSSFFFTESPSPIHMINQIVTELAAKPDNLLDKG